MSRSTTTRRRKSPSSTGVLSALFVPIGVADQSASYRQASDEEILATARSLLARRVRRGMTLSSPSVVKDFLLNKYSALDHEIFALILLDNRHRLIDMVDLFRGTIDGSSVHPRDIVKLVLEKNAAAVIAVHNHPSGVASPSQADELITARIRDALALVDVRLLDHLLVAGDTVVSFAERGLL